MTSAFAGLNGPFSEPIGAFLPLHTCWASLRVNLCGKRPLSCSSMAPAPCAMAPRLGWPAGTLPAPWSLQRTRARSPASPANLLVAIKVRSSSGMGPVGEYARPPCSSFCGPSVGFGVSWLAARGSARAGCATSSTIRSRAVAIGSRARPPVRA